MTLLLQIAILLFLCSESFSSDMEKAKPHALPETILGVSVEFPSDDILSITIDEARNRSRPLVDALVSPDAARRRAAMQLIADCFRSRMSPKLSKYTMMEAALRAWANNASNPPGLKPDRDAFVSAVSAIIEMYNGETRETAAYALVLFLDLELKMDKNDTSESLLRKWKGSPLYGRLVAP